MVTAEHIYNDLAFITFEGSMMILTQRMILLSFSVYDGHARKIDELNETEKRQRVTPQHRARNTQ